MDYEKKYKEALERAKKLKETCDSTAVVGWCEYIFPELKESEDERIRKWLVEMVEELRKANPTNADYNGNCSNAIAWLEKQGEQNLTLPKWKYKKDDTPLLRDSIILNKYGCVAKSPSGALVSDVWVINYDELTKLPKEEFEKQGEKKPYGQRKECEDCQFNYAGECKGYCALKRNEQKHADKVEPKFHEGDWIVHHGTENIYQVVAVIDNLYQLKYGDTYTVQKCTDVDSTMEQY